jgi:hypothetical protein
MAETEHGSWEKAAQDNRTVYSGFLKVATVGTILIAIVLILMAIFLA